MTDDERSKIENVKAAEAEKNNGNDFYRKKDFENALIHYSKAIELNGNEVNFHNNKAAVYFEMKDFESCIAACDDAIKLSRGGYYDYVKLGKALARKANAFAS